MVILWFRASHPFLRVKKYSTCVDHRWPHQSHCRKLCHWFHYFRRRMLRRWLDYLRRRLGISFKVSLGELWGPFPHIQTSRDRVPRNRCCHHALQVPNFLHTDIISRQLHIQ